MCTDSCCIGWEIDIDDKTMRRYDAMQGEIGEQIRDSIRREPQPHFALGKDGRCQNLRADGLCRIICDVGDEMLCDICREHPRYYNTVGSDTECGIGLGCEEAARLILSVHLPLSYICTQQCPDVDIGGCNGNAEDEHALTYLKNVRNTIYEHICNSERIDAGLCRIYDYAAAAEDGMLDVEMGLSDGTRAPEIVDSEKNIHAMFLYAYDTLAACEMLNDELPSALGIARSYAQATAKDNTLAEKLIEPVRRLATYFIHRYLIGATVDGRLAERIRLSCICTAAIAMIAQSKGITDVGRLCDIAKCFSKNIEYSTDNISAIIDSLG